MNTPQIVKILKGDPELTGKTLELVKIENMRYKCQKTGVEVVDCWDELETMKNYPKERHFYDMHLFVAGDQLQFIEEIKLL